MPVWCCASYTRPASMAGGGAQIFTYQALREQPDVVGVSLTYPGTTSEAIGITDVVNDMLCAAAANASGCGTPPASPFP
jgi:hypothetical protein